MNLEGLPTVYFAFPGPLRDRIVTDILSGAKTTTSGLVLWFEREKAPLPEAGTQSVVVDSGDRPVAVIELTEVRVVRLADVDPRHARDERAGGQTVAQWRTEHEEFWHSPSMREALGDPDFTVADDTLVLAQRFRVVHTL